MPMEPTVQLSADGVNLRNRPAGLIPRHWCDACAEHTWVVTLEEVIEIASIGPSCYGPRAGKATMMRNIHSVTTSTGASLICLRSFFLCIFSACEQPIRR